MSIFGSLEQAKSTEEGFRALEGIGKARLRQICDHYDFVPLASASSADLRRVIVSIVVTSKINAQVFRNLDLG